MLPALHPHHSRTLAGLAALAQPWHSQWELAVLPAGTRALPCLALPCPAPGLLLHFPLDLGPILAARRALVNEPCSVPSQVLGLSKQVCGMWQCGP